MEASIARTSTYELGSDRLGFVTEAFLRADPGARLAADTVHRIFQAHDYAGVVGEIARLVRGGKGLGVLLRLHHRLRLDRTDTQAIRRLALGLTSRRALLQGGGDRFSRLGLGFLPGLGAASSLIVWSFEAVACTTGPSPATGPTPVPVPGNTGRVSSVTKSPVSDSSCN